MRDILKQEELKYSKAQRFIYRNKFGRIFLKLLISKPVSKVVGAFLSSPFSTFLIKGFIKNNNIDMSQFEDKKFSCYNDFFTRKINLENRPMSATKDELISPADSKVLKFNIDENLKFTIKNGSYSLSTLIGNNALAKEFLGGTLLVFRLCVDDYHRYCFVDNGEIESNKFIAGKLHTVQPIALEKDDFFKENCREITVVNTENFGKVIMVEIGAMMVGKIVNHQRSGFLYKGEEKGYFEFGGSTVCLILKKDAVKIDKEIEENSRDLTETKVLFRETIGTK